MIKRSIIIIILTFSLSPIFSQDIMAYFRNQAPSFIAVNAGCAFPAGRFSQKKIYENYNNPYHIDMPKLPLTGESEYNVAGFANPGFNISINGSWYFIKFLGVGLRASFSQNFLAVKKLDQVYDAAYNNGDGSTYKFNFSTNDFFYSAYVAPGIYFSIPIARQLYFSLEAGFGAFYSHFPEFTCDYSFNDQTYRENTKSSSEWDFSYYMAIGAKYRTEGILGFSLELSYNEFFAEHELRTTRGNYYAENTVPVFYKNLNLSLGVVLFLGRE